MTAPHPLPDDDGPLFGAPTGGPLFGAAESVGAFEPAPVVTIDDVDIARGAGGTGTPAGLVVLDGIEIAWGHDDVMDQPDSPTGTVTLFDPSSTWATSLDLRGRPVVLSWEGTDPATGPVRWAFFRGRIGAPVRISRKTVHTPDGPLTGSLVELPLVSVPVDLANRIPTVAWPTETFAQRAARIAAAAADLLTGGVTIRDYWSTPPVPAVAAKDQVSLWDHLVALFDSCGADRLRYRPNLNEVSFVQRRVWWNERGHGRLWWDVATAGPTPRADKGVYVRATGTGGSVYPAYFDADELEYDPAEGITQPPRITHMRLTYPDPADATKTITAERAVVGRDDVRRNGVRTAAVDSLLWSTNAAWYDAAFTELDELTDLAAGWRLEPLRWSSRRAGGFPSYTAAQQMIGGYESQNLVHIAGSWLPVYGLRPVFGVMGGTVAYRDGGWECEYVITPIADKISQHAITWEEIDDGSAGYEVRWYDVDHPRGMHSSLTYEDLGWVSVGMGASPTPGPDTGWDSFAP